MERTLPDHLFVLGFDRAKAGFIESERISASQQRATSGSFPFPVFLFQFPRLQLRAAPAEIFGSDAMQRRERRDSKARQDIRRYIIEESRPATERSGGP